jgi:hypothetical protein
MVDTKKTYSVKQGNGDVLHRTVFKSVECPRYGEKSRLVKVTMLRHIVDNPDIAGSANVDFGSLSMKYQHGCWIIEATAIEGAEES